MENIDLGLEIKPREKNQNGLRSGLIIIIKTTTNKSPAWRNADKKNDH